MKRIIALILIAVTVLGLCGCGILNKKIDPQIEIVGTWEYDTGKTVWTFTFRSDGSCPINPPGLPS